ncbi:MAG: type II secretion system inner membrane protein GspF [Thermodesulfobacteriota bacterium]|nr:type II secretion system inner membrane protein GspF [Thermodesulfobacteriota bacterium]
MPVFEYSAITARGEKKQGIIDADSRSTAVTRLKKQDLYPVSIREINAEASLPNQGRSASFLFFSRIHSSEISMITRQLATLLSAGFPLVSALSALVSQTDSTAFQKILSKIKGAVEEGDSFAAALAMYPSVFSPVYINMVRAGESSGTLEIVLERLADISEKKEEIKKNLQASLAYPLLMTVVGCLVLFFLLTCIVPGIVDIFSEMQHTLPAPTRFLIAVSSAFKSMGLFLLVIPLVIPVVFHLIRKNDKTACALDRTLLKIPKAGDLYQKINAARFTRIFGSLLENGVPMLTALDISRTITGNRVFFQIITRAAESVQQGGELGKALENEPLFPSLASGMIQVGEKSGKLENMLEKTADLYEKEVTASVAAMTALLEPVIILAMGAVVGFIVLSVCLPIFEMNQLVR